MFGRAKVAPLVGEFLGTAILASVVLSMAARTGFPFFAAIIAGLTLGLMVLVIGPSSGAHINPAVTVGLWTQRKIETAAALMYVGAQMLGAAAAWQLNEFLLNKPLRNIAGSEFDWRVFTAEAVGAFVFTFALSAAVSKGYDYAKTAFVAGGGLALGILAASLASNAIINPAVALGLQSWSWAYAAGPVAGALVGFNLYTMVFEAPAKKSVTKKASTTKASSKTKAKRKK